MHFIIPGAQETSAFWGKVHKNNWNVLTFQKKLVDKRNPIIKRTKSSVLSNQGFSRRDLGHIALRRMEDISEICPN